MESSFSQHLAARPEWLEFLWFSSDVSIEYSAAFPDPNTPDSIALRQKFHNVPRRDAYRRSAKKTAEI
eukprot:2851341-Amphidinium_carterae.1